MSYPRSQWFQPGDGIAREVITADIQRYLGNDALVRPGKGSGEYKGIDGYWITAYRALTSQMVQDLKMDSQRWRAEVQQGRVAYQDSRTHQSRQYYGPTTPAPEVSYAAQASPAYPPSRSSGSSHSAYSVPSTSSYDQGAYTHAPSSYSYTTSAHGSSQPSYGSSASAYPAAQPRTTSQTPYPYGSAEIPRAPDPYAGGSSYGYPPQPTAATPRASEYAPQPPPSVAPQYVDRYGRPVQYTQAPSSGRRR